MRIIQVVPAVDNESSGPSYSVVSLTRGLAQNQTRAELHVPGERSRLCEGVNVSAYPRKTFFHLRGFEWSPEMIVGLKKACQDADIIHNNGLWMMPNVYPWWACKGTKCKLVVAPRGSLAAWSLKKSWLKKKVFGWLLQNAVLRNADMFHATCEKEYEEIRAQGYKQPVAIVPIGMDIPVLETTKYTENTEKKLTTNLTNTHESLETTEDTEGVAAAQFAVKNKELQTPNSEPRTAIRQRRIVFFGRVHKVKAVDNLVKAWGALHADLPDWELVIAGPDCGAKGDLEAIIAEEQIPRVRFTGEINGQAKYDFLTDADIYVLPSHTENFGVTVAEALACGTPSIASQGTPWEGLETEKCGKWVPIGVEPLVTALRELTALSDEDRAAMGQRGIAWIRRDFSWEGIGAKMKAAYAWLLGQGERPDFVKVD